VFFALGPADRVRPLLDELGHDGDLFLHVRPEILPLFQDRYDLGKQTRMWRMTLPRAAYCPPPAPGTVRLGPAGAPALLRLYADGEAAGESPHCFHPSMVEEGVFCGLYEKSELVAVAGTHLVVPGEGVAAVGNIYTRRDRRGCGLAGRVTSAVVNELL